MGPAGLFAALFLARAGIPCVLLERGRPVEERTRDVERFWATGQLSRTSNVQFGEGGAGTFSDGKLTTGTHDPRISAVLDALVEFGAPEDVKWSHKPHIGTDCCACGETSAGSSSPWAATCGSGTSSPAWRSGRAGCAPQSRKTNRADG